LPHQIGCKQSIDNIPYNEVMQLTQNDQINAWIHQLHTLILDIKPDVLVIEQPGFHSNNYLLSTKMGDMVCYIICYAQKANLGFSQGVLLQKDFPFLIGMGKTHRHVAIGDHLKDIWQPITRLIQTAFKMHKQTGP
jgi:hypothetical protein